METETITLRDSGMTVEGEEEIEFLTGMAMLRGEEAITKIISEFRAKHQRIEKDILVTLDAHFIDRMDTIGAALRVMGDVSILNILERKMVERNRAKWFVEMAERKAEESRRNNWHRS